jgi:hypothetical protein
VTRPLQVFMASFDSTNQRKWGWKPSVSRTQQKTPDLSTKIRISTHGSTEKFRLIFASRGRVVSPHKEFGAREPVTSGNWRFAPVLSTDYSNECMSQKFGVRTGQRFKSIKWIRDLTAWKNVLESTSYLLPLASKTIFTDWYAKSSRVPTLIC